MVELLKIGIIGYNEGNGHPYSFSSIINGYDDLHMKNSRYPIIYKYLKKRKKEDFGIPNVKVTHIWTPDISISTEISKCCFIGNVSESYEDFIGNVDAVIIARDDAKSHREIAEFFLKNEVFTFIDKPLCDSYEDLQFFIPFLRKGLLMSCSGLRYYPKILEISKLKNINKNIVYTNSNSFYDWFKYGIHVMESVIPIMGNEISWIQNIGEGENNIVRINYRAGNYSIIILNESSSFILSSQIICKNKTYNINYDDNFTCFKTLLFEFVKQIKSKKPSINPDETINLIYAMIGSNISKSNKGKKIFINELKDGKFKG